MCVCVCVRQGDCVAVGCLGKTQLMYTCVCVRESERESECEKVYVFVCERADERVSVRKYMCLCAREQVRE